MLEINKIHNCDNIVGMKQLPDECIDLVVTSPPYDNLRNYNGYYERVMVYQSFNDGSTFTQMATRIKTNKIEWWYDDDGFVIDKITHWQPIVLPKKEK